MRPFPLGHSVQVEVLRTSLMVPLTVVVRQEVRNRAAKVVLAQRDHAAEALLLDRPNEPLGVRVAIRRAERRLNDPDVLLFQELPHGTTPLSIAITGQHATTSQDGIEPIGQITHGLDDERFVGMTRWADDVHSPRLQLNREYRVARN